MTVVSNLWGRMRTSEFRCQWGAAVGSVPLMPPGPRSPGDIAASLALPRGSGWARASHRAHEAEGIKPQQPFQVRSPTARSNSLPGWEKHGVFLDFPVDTTEFKWGHLHLILKNTQNKSLGVAQQKEGYSFKKVCCDTLYEDEQICSCNWAICIVSWNNKLGLFLLLLHKCKSPFHVTKLQGFFGIEFRVIFNFSCQDYAFAMLMFWIYLAFSPHLFNEN